MAEKACVKRLQKEFRALCKEPVPHIVARPSPNDILEWHYVLEGSEGTPFAGGYYYGKIKFPTEYPFKPPGITSSRELESHVVSIKLDSSPTTGSVTTSAAEKLRLAKASLAFNCKNATFRKMFPEYVEKYNQQLAEQAQTEVSSLPSQEESSSTPNSEKVVNNNNVQENVAGEEALRVGINNRRQSMPTWMVLFLFSMFGLVMALPLLQP
ncbi:hypothetical protein Cgig2_025226 [Carnegiea gigantea]|uniref:UBC core domain-containing protein n=1 Tax=Carnegiea gigantea TaxID=171969 RepID=A0A9Q1QN27_9CARY|nr:hypothetical protein Cgig2_025226 [Carnegiea gigantea]